MSTGRWAALVGLLLCCALSSQALGQTLSFVDAQGQPASVFLESTRAYVRVVDPGANLNGLIAESVTVQIATAVWSDQESLTLQETGPNTGVFEGSIPMRLAGPTVPGNGILETGVSNGPPVHYDTLTASYLDSSGVVRLRGHPGRSRDGRDQSGQDGQVHAGGQLQRLGFVYLYSVGRQRRHGDRYGFDYGDLGQRRSGRQRRLSDGG
jgi:hypothetical protein